MVRTLDFSGQKGIKEATHPTLRSLFGSGTAVMYRTLHVEAHERAVGNEAAHGKQDHVVHERHVDIGHEGGQRASLLWDLHRADAVQVHARLDR